jgi:hypothetical protein
MEFNTTFNDISVISSGLSISYEVAGYFQKVGGEMEVLLCPDIFRPGVWGLQKQCVNLQAVMILIISRSTFMKALEPQS